MIEDANLLEDSYNRRTQKHITFLSDRTIIHANETDKVFIPSDTASRFINSTGFVDLVMGPYGSGKSTMCVQRIVASVAKMPRWSNNRRKARWAIVRNTSGELVSTTLQTWLNWFADLGDIRKRQKPLLTYEHLFNDGHGMIELDLIFIALDRPEDVRKIKSLELTGVYLNELSELPQNVLSHFKGRVNGRYTSRSFCPDPYWSGIIADTNPPSEDHWIFKDFDCTPTPSYTVFHQPSGLLEGPDGLLKDNDGNYIQNQEADNAKHLSANYYPRLAEKQSEGFIKVYCCGRYGLVESGKRVYPEYNDDVHSVAHIEAIQGDPIYLGFDFGLCPACVVVQISPRGQVRVLKEYIAEDIGIRTFATNIVLPRLAIDFVYNRIGGSDADPAGAKGDEIMEELSCIGELNALGITTNAARTNDPSVRINSVRYFLNLMIDGQPSFLLSREGCPVLRKGFMSGYHYKRMSIAGDERYQDKPNKNKFSHCFTGETLIMTNKGNVKISDLQINDKVLTPNGYKKISATMSSFANELLELEFSTGSILICTPDHPFITINGIKRADALQYGDILIGIKEWQGNHYIQSKNLMELNIIKKGKDIIKRIIYYLGLRNICIAMFGNFIMGKSQANIVSITSTTTKATMTLETFNSLAYHYMPLNMDASAQEPKKQRNIWSFSDLLPQSGISQRKAENGILYTLRKPGKIEKKYLSFVQFVAKLLKDLKERIKKAIALMPVNQHSGEILESMMKKESVASARNNLVVTNMQKTEVALGLVHGKHHQIRKEVYDLTIEDEHCFYANGVLVSNCHDALQYSLMRFAGEINKPPTPTNDPFANNLVFRWQN